MNAAKTNSGTRLAMANIYRQIRAILRTSNMKGVKVRLRMDCGKMVMRLIGTRDERKLAKFALDAAFRPAR